MALNGLICADVPLSNYSLTHSKRICSSLQLTINCFYFTVFDYVMYGRPDFI